MRKYKGAVYTSKKVDVLICNLCGNSIKKNQFNYFDDHIKIEKTWEYGSEFDGETHVIDICQCCYKKIFMELKICPTKDDTIIGC